MIPLDDLAELICVGGWPVNLGRPTQLALRANRDHLDEIRRLDIANGDGKRRDPVRVGMLLRSLARNATPLSRPRPSPRTPAKVCPPSRSTRPPTI